MGLNLPIVKIYQSNGLPSHMKKHGHAHCIKYLDKIPEILKKPDYIGKNSKEENSVEFIKKYDGNILVAIKLDKTGDYLYVASMYELKESKLMRRLNSGRMHIYEKTWQVRYFIVI